jgi:hypothetical protein
MLLQTNSYLVPREKRGEHVKLLQRFRQTLARLGCDHFEAYEKTAANWNSAGDGDARFIQIMRFRDRKHQLQVQQAEKTDPGAQQLIREFCDLINFPYQQQQGMFAVGFYSSVLPAVSARVGEAGESLPAIAHASAPSIMPTFDTKPIEAPPELPAPELEMEPADEPPAESIATDDLEDIEPGAAMTEQQSDQTSGDSAESSVDLGDPIEEPELEDLGDPVINPLDDELDLSDIESADDGHPPIDLDDSQPTDKQRTSDEIQH